MRLRLSIQSAALMVVWAAIPLFLPFISPETWQVQGSGLPPNSVGILNAIVPFAIWLWSQPVELVLAGPRAPEVTSHLSRCHRIPLHVALLVLVLTAVKVAVSAWLLAGQGMSLDMNLSRSMLSVALGILVAMLSYAFCASWLAKALENLGVTVDASHAKQALSAKITWVTLGTVVVALLTVSAVAYAQLGGELERESLNEIGRDHDRAVHLGASQYPAVLAESARTVNGLSSVVFSSGALGVAARAGPIPEWAGAPRFHPTAAEGMEHAEVPGGFLVRRTGSTLASYLPVTTLEARRHSFWIRIGWTVLIALCAATMLVVISARALTAPLRSLRSATARITMGDLTLSPTSLADDELGLLADDFHRMTQRLKVLLGDVQEANVGVGDGARAVADIGERVRVGALEQRRGVVAVSGIVEAMRGSVNLMGEGVQGLSEYVGSTSAAVGEMASALEEIRRQGVELDRAMGNTTEDVHGLAAAGQRAETALRELESFASHAEAGLSDVNVSLERLETSAVSSQLTAAQASELSHKAGAVMQETVEGIESLRAVVGDAQRRVTSLGRRSDDIDHIVDFITEVAGRTNLLSLNASIIAAQAGEHGKAFAVVADQIRELASQISNSTKSIGNIIRAVREDVEGTATLIHKGDELAMSGVSLARNSLDAISRMTGAAAQGHDTAAAIREAVQVHARSSGDLSNLVHLVAKGSKAVAQAVDLVGRSVSGVDVVSRGVGQLADQVSHALEEQSGIGRKQLTNLERINNMISEITLLVQNHDNATVGVRDSLHQLSQSSELHETAVRELGALAGLLHGQARALTDRLGKFRV